ncbi:MAG: hypothetical protein ABSH00_11415 [Bryobacteraceae bacterium]
MRYLEVGGECNRVGVTRVHLSAGMFLICGPEDTVHHGDDSR